MATTHRGGTAFNMWSFFSETGVGQEIEVRQSEPERIFNKAAIDAVRQWAFEPVVYRGRTINQRAAARLSFTLE